LQIIEDDDPLPPEEEEEKDDLEVPVFPYLPLLFLSKQSTQNLISSLSPLEI
jgi:hypothetical protein